MAVSPESFPREEDQAAALFHQYTINEVSEHPAFGISVAVTYVAASSGFHTPQSNQTDYKSIMVKVTHKTLSAMTDTMIISSGL
jgi:hypothetical protein